MSISEGIYNLLLKAYAARYLKQYQGPMAQHFRDQLNGVTGPMSLTKLWARTVTDLIRSVPRSYLLGQGQPVFVRMDKEARKAIFFAHHAAMSGSGSEITVEHLLLGMMRSDKDLRDRAGSTRVIEELMRQIGSPMNFAKHGAITRNLPLSKECRQAIDDAGADSKERVNTRDLIAAILRQPDTKAAKVIREFGLGTTGHC